MRQRVADCADADYGALLKRAAELAAGLSRRIRCSGACDNHRSGLLRASWNCTGGTASAAMKVMIGCETTPNTFPGLPGLGVPEDADLSHPGVWRSPDMPLEDLPEAEYEVRELWPKDAIVDTTLDCPSSQLVRYRHRERVEGCPPADYERYVLAAVTDAERYVIAQTCDEPCGRVAWRVERKEWRCRRSRPPRSDHVEVGVFVTVICKS